MKIPAAILISLVAFIAAVFILPCLPAQAADTTPECWAVIVGVSDYLTANDLPYSVKGAREIYQQLSPAWGEDHIRLLADSEASKAGILSAISWMASQADADDTVLFHFSGHGDDGGYFCPWDVIIPVTSTYISSNELTNALMPVKADKIVVILDSCYSGDFKNSLAGDERVILMATDPDEVGWQAWALHDSVFVYYLLQAFANFDEVDTNHDYELSAEEIFNYAVPLTVDYEMLNDFESIQHPTLSDTYLGQIALLARFIFALNTMLPLGTNILTIDGVDYTTLPLPLLWAPGSEHTLAVSQIVNASAGTRYVFVDWDDGVTSYLRVVFKGAFTANYDKELLLAVNSIYGDPTGAGWYKDGSTAGFSVTPLIVTPNTKHIFTQWGGDFTGTSATGSLVMDKPKTLTANWRNEYLLSLISPYNEPNGSGWYNENTMADISINPYVETPDTRHYFTGWSGDFAGTGSSAMVYMNTPKKITANWRNAYLLKIDSEYGSPVGGGWYNEGETATVSIAPVEGFLIRHIFTGWSGDLSVKQSNYHLGVSSPKVITATWQTDYVQLYILIGAVVVLGVTITITVVLVRGTRVVF